MPRQKRVDEAGVCFHAINRGNARQEKCPLTIGRWNAPEFYLGDIYHPTRSMVKTPGVKPGA